MIRLWYPILASVARLAVSGTNDCEPDHCQLAIEAAHIPGQLEGVRSFCSGFTLPVLSPTTPVPSFISAACVQDKDAFVHARISRACSCFVFAPSPTIECLPVSITAPCAIVSSSWSSQKASDPSATPTVAAELAYECLNSVPLHKEAAIELVDAIEPYLEWQSDSAYKAEPPEDYFFPPFDMFSALAQVRENLVADIYVSEYDFQEDLYVSVFCPGHDGHFVFYPDALTRVFEWRRQRSLVSISEDGTSLPVIKIYEDIIASLETASIVSLINGVDAATYVAETIYKATYNRDPDAAYNSMFYEKASVAVGGPLGFFARGGRVRYIYPGANTTFTFENGTTLSLDNVAAVKADMTGVVDGPSYYAKFCSPNGANSTAPGRSQVTAAEEEEVTVIGYPKPVIITQDGVVSGYFLEGEGYEDVAVIAVLSFEPRSPSEFQTVCQRFFALATQAGKTKLIIDFQGNSGGYILQGYDFFRQLFPAIVQEGLSRFKEDPSFLSLASIISDLVADVDPYTEPSANLVRNYQNWFNYRYDLNLFDQPFTSFDDKFYPRVYKATPYTSLLRWNLYDNLTTSNTTFGLGIEITGYGILSNLAQPFSAENMVLLYDGTCASTCAVTSDFFRLQAGVKSIAMGGLPEPGLIQGVGGVRGAQVLQYKSIYDYTSSYLPWVENSLQAAALSRFSSLPVNRSTSAAINARDEILPQNIYNGLPAQYVVEESDCRLYWTEPMIKDVYEVWKATADSAFNGAKCAAGGIERTEAGKCPPRPVALSPLPVFGPLLPEQYRKVNAPVDDVGWMAVHGVKAIP
ncbi:hypothetical protein QBC36DRAFT_333498 [Triangularia setosa]|uniref:CPAF-like PDZ domain-containing protein n=1 Tax=Triangularia setosa TaxID=2587417 RepID=A0AAN7A3Z1_9PEZI|nr:hypothetical protein QBC36DRAFT_333498 [Podospora setosa]